MAAATRGVLYNDMAAANITNKKSNKRHDSTRNKAGKKPPSRWLVLPAVQRAAGGRGDTAPFLIPHDQNHSSLAFPCKSQTKKNNKKDPSIPSRIPRFPMAQTQAANAQPTSKKQDPNKPKHSE